MYWQLRPTAFALCVLLSVCAVAPVPAQDRPSLIVASGADKTIRAWSLPDYNLIATVPAHDAAVNALAASHDHKYVASGAADGKVKVWSTVDGSPVATLDASSKAVTSLGFSMDDKKLFTAGQDMNVKAWDTSTWKSTDTFKAEDSPVVSLLVSPEFIITGGQDGNVHIWDPTFNKIVEFPTVHDGGLTAMGGDIPQQALFTGGPDGKLKYWSQGPTGECDVNQGCAIRAISTVITGSTLVTGGADGGLKFWDTNAHKLIKSVPDAHPGGVNTVVESTDGTTIVTGGADKKVKVWKSDGTLVKTLDAGSASVNTVLFLSGKTAAAKAP